MRWILCLSLVACAGPTGATDSDGDTDPVDAPTTVRVVHWNIEGLGTRGSDEGQAERAVLARLDADVVALNEVDGDERSRLQDLAEDLGFDTAYLPTDNPFGDLRNAVLTRLPTREVRALDAGSLSGDSRAQDVTRLPIRTVVEVPDAEDTLTVVGNHWKSGFDEDDRFRRTLDGIRTAQAAAGAPGEHVLVMGDLNAELEDMPESPRTWTSVPAGLPSSFRLGADQREALAAEGLTNSAFAALQALDYTPLEALQLDGRADTRPVSGRRIDWVLHSPALDGALVSEIYDSTDEGQASGIPKAGEAPDRAVSGLASDHLPIVVDVSLPRAE